MAGERLRWHERPRLTNGKMILAFTGWMDGGGASTGTVEWLVAQLQAEVIAEIDPRGFYLYNFPGSMEVAALFRPHTRIVDGVVEALEFPSNQFYCDRENNLVLFAGREPNLDWADFADAIFDVVRTCGITDIYFVGSFGGLVPHTRDPRLYVAVSDASLKERYRQAGLSFTNYEGPGSFATSLLYQATGRGVRMASLVAAIPAYIQGVNPKSVEAIIRRLTGMLGLQVPLDELRPVSDEWERRLNEAMKDQPELVEQVQKFEADYDNEIFDTQMGDLKQWLEQRGLQVD